MRNRLSNGSKHVALAACMLALGVNFSACTDDYVLDDQKPTWLNSSIYETLESNGGYTNYLALIADPDLNSGDSKEGSLVEILSRTGSKTVFAANDEAWEKFFESNKKLPKSNPWHYAQSYEQLSVSQKKLLLHTSMLNNAIVMENLASSSGNDAARGQYLRRFTDVEAVDTVARIAVTDLPKSYWDADRQTTKEAAEKVETDQWGRIRNGGLLGYDSIYMVLDSSLSMMLHFTNEYMAMKKITDADFRIFMGRERITSDVHIYDALLDSADITCENGYINMTEKPLAPLGNMAEVIRTNGKTNIFSHILDRFSVPFRNYTVGRLFSRLYPEKFQETDTLYTKRYFSKRSYGSSSSSSTALTKDERGIAFGGADADGEGCLIYDPGWNGYHPIGTEPQEDMGAMFVPTDEQLIKYFNEGGGRELLKEYTKDPVGSYSLADLETLYRDIDQIPLNTIYKIVNFAMFDSFVNSVPSKMNALREEMTLEPIFYEQDTKLKEDGGNIDTVMMACNGAVYIMNNVYTPSDFNCVATPAFIRSTNSIMKWAIYSDEDLSNPIMGLNYSAYLKAMQSKFTFLLPNNEAMGYYYDPMSFTSSSKRMLKFIQAKGNFPFQIGAGKASFNYDVKTGTIGTVQRSQQVAQAEIVNRLRMMLEHNTIVHQNGINAINTEEDEYYLSKNGMGIKVTRGLNENGESRVIKVQGGFQLENEREGLAHSNPGILHCNVLTDGEYKNGWTFTLDAPLVPAARSVFSVLSNIDRGVAGDYNEYLADDVVASNPYHQFFLLCLKSNDDLIKKSGLVDESNPLYDITTQQGRDRLEKAIDKYRTFVDNNAVDQNVQFFNNYRYTVFAPKDDAIHEAIANGLPTWDSILEDFNNCEKENDDENDLKHGYDSLRIQAKIIYLTNFVRTHFADNTIFADKSEVGLTEMVTSSYDRDNGVFIKAFVQRVNNGGETVLQVRDNFSTEWRTASNDEKHKNIMTCDRVASKPVKNKDMNGATTEASSYAVVHLIDGVLNHDPLTADGKYPDFTDSQKARAYIKKFAIR